MISTNPSQNPDLREGGRLAVLKLAHREEVARPDTPGFPPIDAPDWLTLQQAACELGISVSTVRRMVRDGSLLNRMVPHRGGFAYLVFIPGSRHGGMKKSVGKRRKLWLIKGSRKDADDVDSAADLDPRVKIESLERQVEQLSHALSRALRTQQKALPSGIGDAGVNDRDPYARYRWLARRPRWWPF
jgi:hypothetical protein